MAFPPQFWTSVLGITSRASAIALYGAPATPGSSFAFSANETEMAISVAPPPGARIGLNTTFRATDIASAKFRSISLRISLEGPRRRMVQALGDLHSSRKEKYLKKCQLGFSIRWSTAGSETPGLTHRQAFQCGKDHTLFRRRHLSSPRFG